MRKTPPISQAFYSNNWFIGSLKQQVETDLQRSMCSVLEAFQATSTTSLFLHLSRVQPAGPTEIHEPSAPMTLIYKHRGRKTHLSWLASGHPHIQITNSHPGLALQTCGCHIWAQMFFTSNVLICHMQSRSRYRLRTGVL